MKDSFQGRENPVWHPFTAYPVQGPRAFFTRGEGAYVYDDKGRRYFDGTSSWWCNTLGHCHPRLVEALSRQARTLDHVMLAPHLHGPALELAERLVAWLGPPFRKVFFSDDGSTAVETALKMSLQYWERRQQGRRKKIVAIDQAYHGDTAGAAAVSHVAVFHEGAFSTGVLRCPVPYCYRCPLGKTFPTCAIACAEQASALIRRHGDEIAAVIVEPLVMGAGGMLTYPKEYVEGLVRAARDCGAVVIFDEVFTGFGRTGQRFALDYLTVKPDVVCLSKGLTAGMLPLGATVVTGELFEAFTGPGRTFFHGHTFTGNPLGTAVALESLKIFEEEQILSRVKPLIHCLASQKERFEALPHVGEVRHLGLIWAVELVADQKTRSVFDPPNGPGWKVAMALWEKGIWLRPLHNTLYVLPPYCTTESDLRDIFEMLYCELQKEEHFGGLV